MTRTPSAWARVGPILLLVCLAVAPTAPLFAQQVHSILSPGTSTLPAPAAPVVRCLTLEEARQLACASNKALALARLNVKEKEYGVDSAWKDYLPKLIANDYFMRFNKPLTNEGDTRGDIPLVPGLILSIPSVNIPVINQNSNLATVMVAQPITKLIGVNAAVQIARADSAAAQAQLDKGTREVLSGVTQAYHGLLGARRIELALALQIQVLEHLQSVQSSPALKVGLVEAQQGLAQVRGQEEQLRHLLNDLLDLPGCTVLELVDPPPCELPLRCAEDAAQLALANSPEVRESEQDIARAQAALKVTQMHLMPDINVISGVANQTIASYVQPDIGYIGVSASWTLFEWGKKKDELNQRQTTIAMANQSLAVARDKVQLAARKAFSTYEESCASFHLAAEMVQARKEIEKDTTDKVAEAKKAVEKAKSEAADLPAIARAMGEKAVGLTAALQQAAELAALQAKGDTSKAELDYLKAEITYRVAHAQLAALVCQP